MAHGSWLMTNDSPCNACAARHRGVFIPDLDEVSMRVPTCFSNTSQCISEIEPDRAGGVPGHDAWGGRKEMREA